MSTRAVPIHKMRDSAQAAMAVALHLAGFHDEASASEAGALQPVTTTAALIVRASAGEPVMLTGRFPADDPDATGYWRLLRGGVRVKRTVVVVGWSDARKAFRVVESRGVGWGQAGRAWVTQDDMRRLLEGKGGRGMAVAFAQARAAS